MFNNAAVVPHTLAALAIQAYPPHWHLKLILSDDGSTENSRTQLETDAFPWPVQTMPAAHAGAAAARNRALAAADSDLIFFLGADIILRPGALALHLNFHTAHPAANDAALGMVRWDPRCHPSPLMEWMTHGGPQNNFDALLAQTHAPAEHYFYASHLSLKRSQFKSAHFATDFEFYGWEDLELGRRLAGELKLHVLHRAIGLHHHTYPPAAIYRRQRLIGQGLTTYQRRHPTASLIPPRGRWHRIKCAAVHYLGILALGRGLAAYTALRWSTPRLFTHLAAAEFWLGVYRARTYPHKVKGYPHNFPQ